MPAARVDVGIDPYKRCAICRWCVQICACILPGGQRRPPLRVRACLHRCVRIYDVLPRGRGRTPHPTQTWQFPRIRIGASQFAGAYCTILSSRLRRATSLCTREALVQCKPATGRRGNPHPYITTKYGDLYHHNPPCPKRQVIPRAGAAPAPDGGRSRRWGTGSCPPRRTGGSRCRAPGA